MQWVKNVTIACEDIQDNLLCIVTDKNAFKVLHCSVFLYFKYLNFKLPKIILC